MFDDAIVGAGILGLAHAYHLAIRGRRVVVFEQRGVIGAPPGGPSRRYGVRFVFGAAVTAYDRPRVLAGGQEWTADHLYLCAGDDLETLFPELLSSAGLVRCKLQMMRYQPYG